MAMRGGRGGFQRSRWVQNKPFVPFPDINLPDAKSILSDLDRKINKDSKEEETIIKETLNWLIKSEYNLDQSDKYDRDEIPEGSNKKPRRGGIDSFSQYLVPSIFPKELTRGSNVRQRSRGNVQWNKVKKSDVDWDLIEKRETDQDAKKKNEGEKDEDDEENNEEEEEEESDGSDDYNEGQYFDDDEDDYNMQDDGDDEPLLDE